LFLASRLHISIRRTSWQGNHTMGVASELSLMANDQRRC
jgi:hypothetical protein